MDYGLPYPPQPQHRERSWPIRAPGTGSPPAPRIFTQRVRMMPGIEREPYTPSGGVLRGVRMEAEGRLRPSPPGQSSSISLWSRTTMAGIEAAGHGQSLPSFSRERARRNARALQMLMHPLWWSLIAGSASPGVHGHPATSPGRWRS